MEASKVSTYNKVALEIKKPVYTYYAGRIHAKTGIESGSCLDIGCGGGYLGLALAKVTDLKFLFLDKSPEMLHCAEENIASHGLTARARTIHGMVQAIPLTDASINLVISRGSIPFWENLPRAFGEIHRVLKSGGCAYIGGGLGDPLTRDAMQEQMQREYPGWQNKQHRPPRRDNKHYADALTAAGIDPFTVTRSDEGLWIEFRKC
jgi:ubiquinone/menaquinone biosynthesis C-methylase UbiE